MPQETHPDDNCCCFLHHHLDIWMFLYVKGKICALQTDIASAIIKSEALILKDVLFPFSSKKLAEFILCLQSWDVRTSHAINLNMNQYRFLDCCVKKDQYCSLTGWHMINTNSPKMYITSNIYLCHSSNIDRITSAKWSIFDRKMTEWNMLELNLASQQMQVDFSLSFDIFSKNSSSIVSNSSHQNIFLMVLITHPVTSGFQSGAETARVF